MEVPISDSDKVNLSTAAFDDVSEKNFCVIIP